MTFDLAAFLATAGIGRRIVQLKPKETFFSQGSPADSIFYLQTGRAKLLSLIHISSKSRAPCIRGKGSR